MSLVPKNAKQTGIASAYATAADFRQIFFEDVSSLFLLSLLLTGNSEKAEQCFVQGVAECTDGNRVFMEWARSWARRTIIQSAIRLVKPHSEPAEQTANIPRVLERVPAVFQEEVGAILRLGPLERFVFVMSFLERFSDHDCSILLGYPRRGIAALRVRAIQKLVTSLGLNRQNEVDANPEALIELTIAQHFASSRMHLNPLATAS